MIGDVVVVASVAVRRVVAAADVAAGETDVRWTHRT